jgi:hypothetical protein
LFLQLYNKIWNHWFHPKKKKKKKKWELPNTLVSMWYYVKSHALNPKPGLVLVCLVPWW